MGPGSDLDVAVVVAGALAGVRPGGVSRSFGLVKHMRLQNYTSAVDDTANV